MAVSVGVALLSGRSSTIEVPSDTCLNDLKRRAEAALGLSGTLLAASGASCRAHVKAAISILQGLGDGVCPCRMRGSLLRNVVRVPISRLYGLQCFLVRIS